MTDEAIANARYVAYINEVSDGNYTWEELKSMGLPSRIDKHGFITWD